ncbi:MAG: polymerase sigma factor FliA [Clostridia bacterium]|nr:polymerase sigma factor FliA [Clostridia bacterium]
MAIKDNTIWATYLSKRESSKRHELVIKYLPLVKHQVNRLAVKLPQHLDHEDLVSYGIIGLMEAIERFDPLRGVSFESYASQRIHGAIIDALRKAHWAPRTLVDKLRRVSQVYRKLEQKLGNDVSDAAVAKEAGITVSELHELMERGSQMALLSLEDFLYKQQDSKGVTRGELLHDPYSPNPVKLFEEQELRQALIESLENLNEKERLVLTLYYYEGLTFKEIGKVLGLSESRICQLHGRAILSLRRKLDDFITNR